MIASKTNSQMHKPNRSISIAFRYYSFSINDRELMKPQNKYCICNKKIAVWFVVHFQVIIHSIKTNAGF